jgi:hypothetical protein
VVTDQEHSRAEDTTRLPLPPFAGKAAGFAVAATAHRTGEGATVVSVDVDPHAMDPVTATISRRAKWSVRE